MTTPLVIRPYQTADGAALYAAVIESSAELSPWLPWCTPEYSPEHAANWITFCETAREMQLEFHFVIEGDNGRLLGGCGLNGLDWPNTTANLGYWVRTSEAGRGVATQAAKLLCAWAFAHTQLYRLEIRAAVENVASRRVAEKTGGTYEGILRQRLLLPDGRHDLAMYSILRAPS
jgi:ribosomal-protein-serine acetyltransferase